MAPDRKQGYLSKFNPNAVGILRKKWNLRYFDLQGPFLRYKKTKEEAEWRGGLDLTQCHVIDDGTKLGSPLRDVPATSGVGSSTQSSPARDKKKSQTYHTLSIRVDGGKTGDSKKHFRLSHPDPAELQAWIRSLSVYAISSHLSSSADISAADAVAKAAKAASGADSASLTPVAAAKVKRRLVNKKKGATPQSARKEPASPIIVPLLTPSAVAVLADESVSKKPLAGSASSLYLERSQKDLLLNFSSYTSIFRYHPLRWLLVLVMGIYSFSS